MSTTVTVEQDGAPVVLSPALLHHLEDYAATLTALAATAERLGLTLTATTEEEVPTTEVTVDQPGVVPPDTTDQPTTPDGWVVITDQLPLPPVTPKAPKAKALNGVPAGEGCTATPCEHNNYDKQPHCHRKGCENYRDICPVHIRPEAAAKLAAQAAATAKAEEVAKTA